MDTDVGVPIVRPADLSGQDAESVSRLVQAYLIQTEREKAAYLGSALIDAALSQMRTTAGLGWRRRAG